MKSVYQELGNKNKLVSVTRFERHKEEKVEAKLVKAKDRQAGRQAGNYNKTVSHKWVNYHQNLPFLLGISQSSFGEFFCLRGLLRNT